MISCNSAFEQGNLDLWRCINAFIIIIIMLYTASNINSHNSYNKMLYIVTMHTYEQWYTEIYYNDTSYHETNYINNLNPLVSGF